MEIVAINGSPKGDDSITLQYLHLIKNRYKDDKFHIYNIGQNIKKVEENKNYLDNIMKKISEVDAVLWITPVYHFRIPGQLHRFIEIIIERQYTNIFHNKISTAIFSSVHFFDTMAEKYLQEISETMGMKYYSGILLDMNDIENKAKRESLYQRYIIFKRKVKLNIKPLPVLDKIEYKKFIYKPRLKKTITATQRAYKLLIVTDYKNESTNIYKMLQKFLSENNNQYEIINLNDLNIKNGCLGCCCCSSKNICVIKDELNEIYSKKMKEADAILYFFSLGTKYFSSRVKYFYDRSFVNGHAPVYQDKQILYFVEDIAKGVNDIKEEIKARTEIGHQNLVAIIDDSSKNSEEIDQVIEFAYQDLEYCLENRISFNSSFYHEAGQKIFRDLVHKMKVIFNADHKYYKKINYYDFPNKNIFKNILYSFGYFILSRKFIRKELDKKMISGMANSAKKIVEKEKKVEILGERFNAN